MKPKKLLLILIFTNLCLTTFADNTSTTKTTTSSKKSTKVATKTKTTSPSKAKKSSPAGSGITVSSSVDCEDGTPCLVVSETTKMVLEEIDNNQTSAITDTVVPHFDFYLMTKYALGHNWKQATPEQQTELVNSFKQLLIFTYSTALSRFKGAKINITSSTINSSGKLAAVVSQVSLPSAATNNTNQPVRVEYNLANTTGEWKAYDIKIENASLVTTYRNQFNDIVQQSQIEGLIKQLHTKVNSLKKSRAADDNT